MTDQTKKPTANDLKLRLNGKLDKVEQFDGQNGPIYESLVILPAQDAYSSPPRFAVKSTSKFGKQGSAVDVQVTVRSRYWKSNSGKINHSPELWLDEAA